MRGLRLGLSILALTGLLGCGGRVIEQPGSGGSDSSAPGSKGTAASAGNASSSDPFPSHALGACAPGFNRAQNPGRPCRWLIEAGECFDDINDACACVCPRGKGKTVCWSGFDSGPNGATLVSCE